VWAADKHSFGVEGPGVVEALERRRLALILPADGRPAVRARVEEDPHLPVPATHEDHRSGTYGAPHERPRLRDLRPVADVEPRMIKDPLDLQIEQLLRGHR